MVSLPAVLILQVQRFSNLLVCCAIDSDPWSLPSRDGSRVWQGGYTMARVNVEKFCHSIRVIFIAEFLGALLWICHCLHAHFTLTSAYFSSKNVLGKLKIFSSF